MKKFYRLIMYCIGLLILALGIILNAKTSLGISPIMTIPYCISTIWGISLGNATLIIYILYVVGQMILSGKEFRTVDLLQIPMSIVFSRIINIFNDIITIKYNNLIINLFLLIAAIILTGIGAAISVEMKIVPNAADGFAHSIGEKVKKDFGFGKNILDISSVLITLVIGLMFTGSIVGIGIGTLAAVFGIGRSIALTNFLFKKKMFALANK